MENQVREARNISETERLLCRLISSGELSSGDFDGYSERDRKQLITYAIDQGLGPLLFWKLRSYPVQNIFNEEHQSVLAKAYYETKAKNQIYWNWLAQILRKSAQENIDVIVLKGADLSVSLYPEPALRPMGDIDLLIDYAEIDQFCLILEAYGFRPAAPERKKGHRLYTDYHTSFVKNEGLIPIKVELHWNLIASPYSGIAPDANWFWSLSRDYDIHSVLNQLSPTEPGDLQRYRQLIPESHFLYLAAHLGIQHGIENRRLIWWFDLDLLARSAKEEMDWNTILDGAKKFSWVGNLREVLLGLLERFATDLPPELFEDTKNFSARSSKLKPASRTARHRAAFRDLSKKDRLNFLWGLIFPSAHFMLHRYQVNYKWQLPYFYLKRWIEIGVEFFYQSIRSSR